MTYCVAICLQEGIVFLSDTRTNAGVDDIGLFRKMTIFQKDEQRLFALLSSGNLAITQAVQEILHQGTLFEGINLWSAKSTYEAAVVVGHAIRKVKERYQQAFDEEKINFVCNFLFGGQIQGERPRLFHIYAAGNFLESTQETCYLQIGEAKYGKPILDRVLNYQTPIELATKCALISMDSTLKSNISVGLPLDLLVFEKNQFTPSKLVTIDENNAYFSMIRNLWGQKLTEIVMGIQEPAWDLPQHPLSITSSSGQRATMGAEGSMGTIPLIKPTQ